MVSKEKKLQTKIIEYLESKGAYVIKIIVASNSGVLDLVVCYQGHFISIEVKGESEVTALQEYNIEQVKKAGGTAIVAYDISEVVDLIDEISYRNNVARSR